METKTVVKVKSDNFENELMAFNAYRELRRQMSTGDFHTHKYSIIEVPIETEVIELEDLE